MSSQLVRDHIEIIRNSHALPDLGRAELVKQLRKIGLLTPDFANAKTAKSQGFGFASYILHLAPSKVSGYNVCPAASKGCAAACLNTAGRGRFDSIQESRIRKTLYFIKFQKEFMAHLYTEIKKLEIKAKKDGLKPVVRLNGTSDVPWENLKIDGQNLFQLFPNVQFYDYTKVLIRLAKLKAMDLKNYNVTFSCSESNWTECVTAMGLGFNVAVVFDTIPKTYQGFNVINGDDSHGDLRFLDAPNSIVGLRAKGDAKKDLSGFVKRLDAVKQAA